MEPTLTLDQGVLIGLIAAALAQVIRFIVAKTGKPVSKFWVTVILFVLSLGIGTVWMKPILPALPIFDPDPTVYSQTLLKYAGDILAVLTALVGFATVIYNFGFNKLLEKLKIGSETIDALLLPDTDVPVEPSKATATRLAQKKPTAK